MGCDYYINRKLIMVYQDKSGDVVEKILIEYTQNCYVDNSHNHLINPPCDDIIKKMTYKLNIFCDSKWQLETYRKTYAEYLSKEGYDEKNMIKLYEDSVAWKRN